MINHECFALRDALASTSYFLEVSYNAINEDVYAACMHCMLGNTYWFT